MSCSIQLQTLLIYFPEMEVKWKGSGDDGGWDNPWNRHHQHYYHLYSFMLLTPTNIQSTSHSNAFGSQKDICMWVSLFAHNRIILSGVGRESKREVGMMRMTMLMGGSDKCKHLLHLRSANNKQHISDPLCFHFIESAWPLSCYPS